eukprot:3935407-Rhodomonas_salina.6
MSEPDIASEQTLHEGIKCLHLRVVADGERDVGADSVDDGGVEGRVAQRHAPRLDVHVEQTHFCIEHVERDQTPRQPHVVWSQIQHHVRVLRDRCRPSPEVSDLQRRQA